MLLLYSTLWSGNGRRAPYCGLTSDSCRQTFGRSKCDMIVCHGVCGIGRCIEVVFAANVRKWEGMVRDDERELEKLKKEEQKMMKVTVGALSESHSCV